MLINILQFLLSLSILIVLHECGHFFPAKWFKTKVEKFYLFFDPYFSLFKIQKGETEYGIGWLPLGGYVKIAGMIDESFDKEQMAGPPQPWEFRSKPAWQRLIIMIGGIFVNMVLGVFLFSMIFWHWGERYIDNYGLYDGIYVDSIGYEMGMRNGDRVLKIGDKDYDKFKPGIVTKEIIINDAKTILVDRKGVNIELPIDAKWVKELSKYENRGVSLFDARIPPIVGGVGKDTPAEKNAIQIGDKITSFNGTPIYFINELQDFIKDRKSENVTLQIQRDGSMLDKSFTLDDGRIGVYWSDESMPYKTQEYSLIPAIGAGWNRSVEFLSDQIKAFGGMFSGKIKASDSLGSFISIGKMFGTEWVWLRFWEMTAMLSILLGFINFLPIPALDGGHIMFLLWEVITGRKPSDKVIEYSTMVGFLFLVILMVYALGLDISRLFK